jgi:peptide/nickel transport system ATP-binding protein
MTPLLSVGELRVAFPTGAGPVEVVKGLSFQLGRERLGIVGESGSGKSLTGRAIMGLTPPNAAVSASELTLDGVDMLRMSEQERRRLRGARLAMILQDPRYALNPVMAVGEQIAETLRAHHRVRKAEARDRVHAMLISVGVRDPDRLYGLYPHEISGGMSQRAMLAMMLISGPELLIADEPTSALDVTLQLEVLAVLDRLVAERGMGLIFISHDLRLVSSFCDRVIVMYAGRIVEQLAASELARAEHPYTRGLLACMPKLRGGQHPLPVLNRDPDWAS